MTIATTRYAQPYVQDTDEHETQRRAKLLRERLETDPLFAAAEEARRERIENDRSLPEWLKAIYLDQTILDNAQLRSFFGGVSIQKIWDLSAPMQPKRRPRPHPRMTPEPDVTLKVIGGRPSPGLQLGKAAEWWVGSHRGLIDAANERLVPNEAPQRHGRARGPEVVEESWFIEHAAEIETVKQLVPNWVDDAMSTTIKAVLDLGRNHPTLMIPGTDLRGVRDYETARKVSRCLRVLRSRELEDRKKGAPQKRS